KNKDVTYTLGYNYSDYNYKWAVKAPEMIDLSNYSTLYTNANIDLSDFTELEIGYNKYTDQSDTDSKYSNYTSSYGYPSNYVYMKYHANF
ncbi:MAG: hypothetical protein PHH60_02100, partial [Candidatus Margulisbacteria bacterium]|nr:hypothetical protein [Candidatus Margulisiibacteriota bacterium]